ncbi:hypothetical protein PENTCL1PPCAC_27229, partial [Pristionchus entomophagus]
GEQTLRGPFSEREMQNRYRDKEINPMARVYFTDGAEIEKSYTLLELRSLCGIGCPFINPESLPVNRPSNTDEIQMKGILMGLTEIRSQCVKLDDMETEIESMTLYIKTKKIASLRSKSDPKNKTAIARSYYESGPNLYGLTRAERLEKLNKGIDALRFTLHSLPSLEDRVTATRAACEANSIEHAKFAYSKMYVTTDITVIKEDEKQIEAMNADLVDDVWMIDYEKAPVRPKQCSRTNWVLHTKMAKKLAKAVHHLCVTMKTGSTRTLDMKSIYDTTQSVDKWYPKWGKGALELEIGYLIAHELVMALKDIDYFFCIFCQSMQFNVKQGLGHFGSGEHAHCIEEPDGVDQERWMGQRYIAFITLMLKSVTTFQYDLHDTDTTQALAPFLMRNFLSPSPRSDYTPFKNFLKDMNIKYEDKINGNIDCGKLNDTVYAASILQRIVEKHKSDIGRQLFAEIDSYFMEAEKEGQHFYCTECQSILTSRARYYKHIKNLVHISRISQLIFKDKTHTFDIFSLSINIHMSKKN